MISLTDTENSIFDILLETANETNTVVRVSGGWVRDKILGLDSNDIDITIDNMSGVSFALRIIEYLGMDDRVGIIKSNPEKSKHIETAVIHLLNTEIQLTGFRKETYNDNSRIPKTEHGNILEETYRRDFTINSLYYNINTKIIEDISEQGINDLNKKVVRLMVPPKKLWERMNINDQGQANKKSFTDDPLRILRAIRFACKYNFKLDSYLIDAAAQNDVIDAFRQKVSRERIQIEFRKMLSENDPHRAIRLLKDFGIFDDIIKLPPGYFGWDMDQNTPHHEFTVWGHTLTAINNHQTALKRVQMSNEDKFILNMAILLHDTGKLDPSVHGKKVLKNGKTKTTYYNHEKSSAAATEYALLRLPGIRTDEIKRIQKLIEGAGRVNPNYTPGNQCCNLSRKVLGRFIRFMGNDWKKAILIHMADVSSKKRNKTEDCMYHWDMVTKIERMNPQKIMEMKPLLDGNEIVLLINKKPGPWVGSIISKMIDWQLKNPNVTKKDAEGFVKSFRSSV